ncbi:MAG: site-specific DNA-methyltransferase [Candidatus Moranbacteria bacterium]|nr:site-specific DNA-methyltransferase [Candidatus Moranbacteria bacterium]
MPEKVDTTSRDLLSDELERFSAIFPQFVKEGKVDTEALRAFFDEAGLSAEDEKYGLSWAGKNDAFRAIRMPSTGTLAPQKDESRDWDGTGNVFIEGDNLEVLKLLQKRYYGAVKMIYIDPPYNTGKDFVYRDNFTESVADYYERTGQSEGGIRLSANTEKNGRYHSDWLTMMYPRLFLAKNLLRQDGVIFISIDDNEVANLRLVMDEIFGEENFISDIIWEKRFTRSNNAKTFASLTEHVLLYRRSDVTQELKEPRNEKADSTYSNPDDDPRGVWTSVSYVNPATKEQRPNLCYPLLNPHTNKDVVHPTNAWKYAREVYEKHNADNRLYWGKNGGNTYPRLKVFLTEMEGGMVPVNLWKHQSTGTTDEASKNLQELLGVKVFDFPKPIGLIQRMLRIATKHDDIILDFFAGSGSTAHAVMAQNAEDGGSRKWICVQIPEETDEASEAYKAGYKTISAISRERIRRAGEKIASSVVNPLRPSDTSLSVEGEGTSSPAQGEVASLRADGEGVDTGFKAYALSPSNYRKWRDITAEDDEETLRKQIALFAEKPLVDSFGEEGVVYEVLVKEGFDLNASVATSEAGGMKVWTITDGDRKLVMTLADAVTREAFDGLGLVSADTFVCLDSALDDTTKLNLARSVNLKTI